MVWRRWIEREGINKVAGQIGVSKETVRLWVKTEQNPADKHKRELVKMCDSEFGYSDFFKGAV